jgi:hypothetical protein
MELKMGFDKKILENDGLLDVELDNGVYKYSL